MKMRGVFRYALCGVCAASPRMRIKKKRLKEVRHVSIRQEWDINDLGLGRALRGYRLRGGGGGRAGGGPITVTGIVVDSKNTAVSGANIMLNHDATSLLTTGATGTFSFANVTPPYTLTMRSGTDLLEYRGLSRADLLLSSDSGGAAYAVTLAGSVTGPAYPLPLDQGILMGATNGVLTSGSANPTTGDYSSLFGWSGGPARTTDLAALHFSYDSAKLITGYIQTGTRTGVNLNSGVNQTGLSIALSSPVSTASTIFNYNPGAYTVNTSGGYLMLKANGAHFLAAAAPIPSGTSVLLPGGGATFLIRGDDIDGNSIIKIGTAVLGGTTTLDLPASTILKNSLPATGATNISKTPTLAWTPVSGAELYLVTITASGLRYDVYLPGSSVTLTVPDYSALGLPLAGSINYSWSVVAFASSGLSMDSLTDPATGGATELFLYEASNLIYYRSANTNFTTTP